MNDSKYYNSSIDFSYVSNEKMLFYMLFTMSKVCTKSFNEN